MKPSDAVTPPPPPEGKIHYSRSLPLAKATGDVLLALRMNGRPLVPSHGFPLRAVVPGWYGMAAVKWLTRVVVSSEPYHGYYQTIDYSFWERGSTTPTLLPITEPGCDAFDFSAAVFRGRCGEEGFKRFEVSHRYGPSSAVVA